MQVPEVLRTTRNRMRNEKTDEEMFSPRARTGVGVGGAPAHAHKEVSFEMRLVNCKVAKWSSQGSH